MVTGSSDGFVEVWGEPILPSSNQEDGAATNPDRTSTDLGALLSTDVDFEKLRTSDLPYQRRDDLMMHESSVLAVDVSHDGSLLGTASADGTVCVWKIADGKLLRRMDRAHGGIGGASDQGELAVLCVVTPASLTVKLTSALRIAASFRLLLLA